MAESWRHLGALPTVPVYVSLSGNANSAQTAISGVVSLTGSVLTEQLYTSTNGTNFLSEYATLWTAGNAGLESASVAKASPGKLYQAVVTNASSVGLWFQTFDRITTPPNGVLPSSSVYVAPSGNLNLSYNNGKTFNTGICVGFSTYNTAFSGANSGSFQLFYK